MEYILLNVLPTIATILLVWSYVPQLVHTYKTKDVTGISKSFWISIVCALTLMTINSVHTYFLTGGYGYVITEVFNLGLAVAMLVMVIKYRK